MSCNKCKQSPRHQGDSWCLPCSAWQQLGFELAERWPVPGGRILAGDLIISTLRQVRALRRLTNSGAGGSPAPSGSGLPAAEAGHPRTDKARPEGGDPTPPGLKAAAKSGAASSRPDEKKRGQAEASVSESEEASSPREVREREPLARPRREHVSKSEESVESQGEESRTRRRGVKRRAPERDRDTRRGKRDKQRRGGRNHQRLHRAEQDPYRVFHQRRPGSFWDRGHADQSKADFELPPHQ